MTGHSTLHWACLSMVLSTLSSVSMDPFWTLCNTVTVSYLAFTQGIRSSSLYDLARVFPGSEFGLYYYKASRWIIIHPLQSLRKGMKIPNQSKPNIPGPEQHSSHSAIKWSCACWSSHRCLALVPSIPHRLFGTMYTRWSCFGVYEVIFNVNDQSGHSKSRSKALSTTSIQKWSVRRKWGRTLRVHSWYAQRVNYTHWFYSVGGCVWISYNTSAAKEVPNFQGLLSMLLRFRSAHLQTRKC